MEIRLPSQLRAAPARALLCTGVAAAGASELVRASAEGRCLRASGVLLVLTTVAVSAEPLLRMRLIQVMSRRCLHDPSSARSPAYDFGNNFGLKMWSGVVMVHKEDY